jgi:hypothetical protein
MDEEGGGTHDNTGVKEEARRWRTLMMRMMMVLDMYCVRSHSQ